MANTTKKVQKVGDRKEPLCIVVEKNGQQIDLSTATATFRIETDDGTAVQAGASVTTQPTFSFTASSSGLAVRNNHGIEEGQQVIVSSAGTLPSGLSASTRYFAVNVTPNAFGLASLPGGISVIAGAGTGTHSFYVVGSIQYAWAAADVLSARNLRGWVLWTDGSSLVQTFPDDGHIPIEIQGVGN
jgi:hypothetical protein